jgi:hypothetical protein
MGYFQCSYGVRVSFALDEPLGWRSMVATLRRCAAGTVAFRAVCCKGAPLRRSCVAASLLGRFDPMACAAGCPWDFRLGTLRTRGIL